MDPIALLQRLLELYSPTGSEAEAVGFLVAQMRDAGMRAFVDEAGNAVGEVGEGPVEVMLLGHIDTVPGFIPVRREGDRLYGRGAVDAKGPLAAFVAATVQAMAAGEGGPGEGGPGEHMGSPLRNRGRIVVVGAVGEEGDSRGARFIRDRYRPRALIIGEPSGWQRITLGYKGSAWFEYRVRRTLAHTAAQAQSAPEAAVAFWNRVTALATAFNAGRERMWDQVIPTLREMHSDSDGFEEHARLRIGVRLPAGLSVEDTSAMLAGEAGDGELRLEDGVPAFRAEKNTALVRALLAGIRQHGGSPAFSLKSGTSDMNVVAPEWRCPAVAYGPGDASLDHTPNEHLLVSEFDRAVGVLVSILLSDQRSTVAR